MTDKNQALAEIQKIIERFQNLPESERARYNEAQIRHSFILPLFRALGWDIENPAEMTAEELVSGGFADFGFYLNSVPVFYVETKRPREDLNAHIKQAINYAWLKGITWAVLTNFEEIKVFNADVKSTNPLNDIFLNLRWQNYTQADFDLLWLLSKESFIQGQINQQAVRYGRMAQKEPVNQLLFAQLTAWRRDLFKNLRAYGNLFKEDTQKLDEAVQRFLDRLIFIRTVEDRQLEQPRLIQLYRQYEKSRKKDKNLFHELRGLFKEMDEIYNARLFAQHQLDLLDMHDDLLLGKIIEGLYNDPRGYGKYDFSAISADILGNIYEQYLGFKMLDPEGKQAVTDKHTKRKSQGIYYTPQFVVRYIVNQTLGKLLESGKVDPYKIRVLDPACGSGSFLIEAFDVLDRFLMKHGTEDHRQHHRKRRLHILRNNIYGVDLDPQAVEVAQLNLLLRAAIERGKLDTLEHIKVGNSLIDDPEIAGATAFNWQHQFPEVFADGGFDVIVGNPPYGTVLDDKSKKYIRDHYKSYKYKYDSYIYFMELGVRLLKTKGLISYITPQVWLELQNGEPLRRYLHDAGNLSLLRIHGEDVFEAAVVSCATFIFQKDSPPGDITIEFEDDRSWNLSLSDWEAAQYLTLEYRISPAAKPIIEKVRNSSKLLGDYGEVIQGITPYDKYRGQSPEIIKSKAYHSNKKEGDEWGKWLKGEDVTRYHLEWSGQWIRYGNWLAAPREPRFFTGSRLLFREVPGVGKRIQAAYAEETLYCGHSITPFKLKNLEISGYYLLAIVNSSLVSFYSNATFSNFGKATFPKLNPGDITSLPIYPINCDDPADKARHDQLVSLVETMLQLKKDYAAADALKEDRRHDLAHRITATDAAIDALVYELYGLTDEEIALIEGN